MAKKAAKKSAKKKTDTLPQNVLPQNIVTVGEHVEEDKNIYISQKTYKEIHRFTKDKTTNESGGVLVGTILEDFGKTHIIINGFIEGRYCKATPTTLKFTHETWKQIHADLDKKYPGQKILGWIHTHPDFGIFLSEYDKFIQQNFFNDANQVAYVVDPIQDIEGFYFWINGNIERCKGFYIFDKNGVRITAVEEKEKDETRKTKPSSSWKIVSACMAAVMLIMLFFLFSQNSEIKQIKEQMNQLVSSANLSLSMLQQQVSSLQQEIDLLQEELSVVYPDGSSQGMQTDSESS